MKKFANSTDVFIDPVCWMKVTPERKDFVFNYKMRSYYFCSEACCKVFGANPDKYLELQAPKRKGWWKRYLERLNKTTGGKPLQCH